MTTLATFFCAIVIFAANVRSDDSSLTPFAKNVKSNIPDDVFKNLFQVSYKGKDDFKKAVMEAIDNFNKAADITIPPKVTEEIKEKAAEVVDTITPEQFFRVFANAVLLTLKQEGKIASDNKDDLAKSYAKFLKNAAKSLKEEDLYYTLPAVTEATAEFLKSEDIYGEQSKLAPFGNNLFSEVDKL